MRLLWLAEVIVKEQGTSLPSTAVNRRCGPAERVASCEAGAQAVSFVIRIWKQTGPAAPECRGWIEHVQSGQRTFFLGLDQLLSIIATHIGVPIRRGRRWRHRLTRWRERVVGYFARSEEG